MGFLVDWDRGRRRRRNETMDGAALREALDKARSTEERLHGLISALDNAESTTKSTHGDAAAVVEEMFAAARGRVRRLRKRAAKSDGILNEAEGTIVDGVDAAHQATVTEQDVDYMQRCVASFSFLHQIHRKLAEEEHVRAESASPSEEEEVATNGLDLIASTGASTPVMEIIDIVHSATFSRRCAACQRGSMVAWDKWRGPRFLQPCEAPSSRWIISEREHHIELSH